ncbi:MAG: OsmC family protein [Candidatus Velthaea sp.]|jgi:osmotically inducible protein OsmC
MSTTQQIVRSATIHWEGDIAHGRGSIATQSGKVSADYSFGTRFSGDPGTNPEELLAASHAACFTMALSAQLTRAGHAPTALDTKANVHLSPIQGGFEIPAIDLAVTGVVPNLSPEEFTKLATEAKESCPLSRALRAVPINLTATLANGSS